MVDEAEYQRVCEELRNIKSEIDCFKETHDELLAVIKKSNVQLASEVSGLKKRILELEAENDDYEVALESITIERDEALEQIESAREQMEGMFEL